MGTELNLSSTGWWDSLSFGDDHSILANETEVGERAHTVDYLERNVYDT